MLSTIHRNTFVRHAVAIFATGIVAPVIAYLTLTPQKLNMAPGSDKLYHTLAFAALAFPCAFLYARTLVWVLPMALFFGGAIELIQPYVGRGAELADFAADAVGVILGATLGLTLRAVFLTRTSPTTAVR